MIVSVVTLTLSMLADARIASNSHQPWHVAQVVTRPHPHPGGLPPPPPPLPWDDAALERRMRDLQAEYDAMAPAYALAFMEAKRLIDALPPTPSQSMWRTAWQALVRMDDQIERMRQIAIGVDVAGLVAAKSISERDAHLVASFRHLVSRSENGMRLQSQEWRLRLQAQRPPH